ncbi:heavy metal transporter [Streptomyces cavernicola]|uniref:Heavy metal transporter n=1 Tax=Streptomyces cavernicola TaxID=3043613 RepID=A0ABT6SIE6_9ACTN|nr:heavy metal transporter [Streptomyces sp. B-S-A6]MDI3407789.1 heavy metal transporter [Streptomyces sp. B-S-A6]
MPEQPPTFFRRGRVLRAAAAFAVLLALAGYLLLQYEGGGRPAPGCRVVSAAGDGGTYEMSTEQAVNAAAISAVGTSRGMPERAVTIALATALQESALRNIEHGDRDSLGLFQQRPSQGWGNTEQIMDPVYSAGKFYEHLEKVPGYSRLPLTVAAQRVQRSGYPQAYAKHEPDAALLSAALTGRAAATLTCGTEPAREPGDPQRVREALVRDFGEDVLPRAKGTDAADSADARPARDGKGKAARPTVTVPVSAALSARGRDAQRGWELAHWAVAHASALRIERVSYAGREWSAADSGHQWRKVSDRAPERASGGRSGAAGSVVGGAADEVVITTAQ